MTDETNSPHPDPAPVPVAAPPTTQGPLPVSSPQDREHLKLLSIFYYVFGGLSLLGSCFGVLYLTLGAVMLNAPDAMSEGGSPPPPALGWFMIGMGGFGLLLSVASCVLLILTGRFLAGQRYRMFCLIIAGLICLSVPLGTILGVFTFVVLLRPSVAELFRQKAAENAMSM